MSVKIKSPSSWFDLAVTVPIAVVTALSSLACAVGTASNNTNVARNNPCDFVATTQKQPFIRKRTWRRAYYPYAGTASDHKSFTLTLLHRDKGILNAHLLADYDPQVIDTGSYLLTPDGSEYRGRLGTNHVPKTKWDAVVWSKFLKHYTRDILQAGVSKELRTQPCKVVISADRRLYSGKWQGQDATVLEYPYEVHYGKPGNLWETEGRVQYFVDFATGLLQGSRVYERNFEQPEVLIEESDYAFAAADNEERGLNPAVFSKEAHPLLHRSATGYSDQEWISNTGR